jgi:UPF0755 protein
MKKVFIGIAAGIVLILLILSYFLFLKKDTAADRVRVVVPLSGKVPTLEWPIQLALLLHGKSADAIKVGGYWITPAQSAWQNAGIILSDPTQKWVVIPEGLRKEEIAELFVKNLGWTGEMKKEWITKDTATDKDHIEGVYFPDTYLIPLDEKPADTAARLITHFNEKFAPLGLEAIKQNIKWTTIVNLASIIQREAAGKGDMALISGVLWNRLDVKMPLGIDATIQYARGDTGSGWWAKITADDKKIDSPFNTFTNKGLPPTPISNPGLEALTAALRPASTTCLYYLHAPDKSIHCADTFEEHKANIEKYLK